LSDWGLACDSQIYRIQAAQNKIARMITGCEWYVRNTINVHSSPYHFRLERHRNRLAKALSRALPPRRLHRRQPKDHKVPLDESQEVMMISNCYIVNCYICIIVLLQLTFVSRRALKG